MFDAAFEFGDGQVITTTSLSDNVLNWGAADLEMGAGEPIWLCAKVGAALTGGGTDLTISLYRHTTATVNSGTVLWTGPTIAAASLTAGAWLVRMPLPYNCDEDAFMGLYYTITGTFTGSGTIDAWLQVGPPSTSFDTQVSVSNI
jgi:hypothetical protein